MTFRHPILQATALLLTAAICALVANAAATPQRRLLFVGNYPNALRVPARSSSSTVSESSARPGPSAFVAPAATMSSPVPAVSTPPATTTRPKAAARAIENNGQPLAAASNTPGVERHLTPVTAAPRSTPSAAPAVVPVAKSAGSAAHPAPSDVSRFAAHPDKPYLEITGADVASLHSAGALFLDARRTSVFEQGHVAGARSLSVWESDLDEKVRKLFDERSDPKEQARPIVIYCSGGDCEDSHMLAEKLWGIQFNNLYVYKDGFPDWQKRGGPVHTGSSP